MLGALLLLQMRLLPQVLPQLLSLPRPRRQRLRAFHPAGAEGA